MRVCVCVRVRVRVCVCGRMFTHVDDRDFGRTENENKIRTGEGEEVASWLLGEESRETKN